VSVRAGYTAAREQEILGNAPDEYLAAYYETEAETRARMLTEALRSQLAAGGIPERAQLVTQSNSLAVVGLEPRKFLEVIRTRGLPVIELGKVRGVRVEALLAALEPTARASSEAQAESQANRLEHAAGLA
jgi:hypothetical protein